MQNADWTDLAYFAAIARHGSLSRAAAATGVSAATLSRRLRGLETTLGRRLFLHGAAGYALTAEGRELLIRARPMEEAAAGVARWQAAARGPVPVRISAGTWTALALAEALPRIWRPGAIWLPEIVQAERSLDIARREIDIGLRNARPDHPWLAGRRVGLTRFAVYAAEADITGWIGASLDAALTPSARWIEETHGARIVTRSNAPALSVQMARAGIGRVVLPLAVGETTPGLLRLSEPIAELDREQWLVAHHEARHDPPIRAALDALAAHFADGSATRGPLERPPPNA
ncbi:LysR family transcriptional regulator [Histidinibacterium lentulum]|uniref:LysR family transcriptional regulator n=1 Tax=Histidinibacterium lentulum TaxID=2480588 RepID=A0A3N2R9X6_9RHOB|nr:LysR family transcriptional regulator [Histidinibacterium lentulum]ROU04264.1 LysR family transcriptional regulator [Histidinibacterium lentulum]